MNGKSSCFLTWVVISLLFGLTVLSPFSFSEPSFSQPSSRSVESQLKAALEDAEPKLGELESWQKLLYKNEVIPQYQRFILDYRGSGQGLTVKVDYDSLKRYLLFYGPKFLDQKDPKVSVLFQPDTSCSKCMESFADVKMLVQSTLERRGFIVSSPDSSKNSPKNSPKNPIATFTLTWGVLPTDMEDSLHPDEKRYFIRTSLQLGTDAIKNHQKELEESDRFDGATAKLMGDIFTELGAKFALQQSVADLEGQEETLLEVSGIKDFAQYIRIKNRATDLMKDISSIDERQFSKGRVVFAVYLKSKNEEFKKQMEKVILDSEKDPSLKVVVH